MADLDYDATIALLNDPDVPLDDVGVPAPPERWTQIAELADRMFYESPLGTQVEHICDVATDRAVRLLAGMPPEEDIFPAHAKGRTDHPRSPQSVA